MSASVLTDVFIPLTPSNWKPYNRTMLRFGVGWYWHDVAPLTQFGRFVFYINLDMNTSFFFLDPPWLLPKLFFRTCYYQLVGLNYKTMYNATSNWSYALGHPAESHLKPPVQGTCYATVFGRIAKRNASFITQPVATSFLLLASWYMSLCLKWDLLGYRCAYCLYINYIHLYINYFQFIEVYRFTQQPLNNNHN